MTSDPRETAIEQESADWYARRELGFTPADQDAFFQWLAADPRHGDCFARHQHVARRLTGLAHWRPEHAARPNPDLLAVGPDWRRDHQSREASASLPSIRGTDGPASSRPSSILRLWLPLAAAAALAAIVWWPRTEALPAETADAPILRKVLEDGSTIDLNRGAQVEVAYGPDRRSVRLLRGEATFHVAKNPGRPFVVLAGGVEVRAVGTAFNVNFQTRSVAVLVTEGKVAVERVDPNALSVDVQAQRPEGQPRQLLQAGERTVVDLTTSAASAIESVPAAEIARVLAWQPRQFEFNDTPLAQVAAEFNRDNRVKLVVDDPVLAALPIGASLRSDNVDGFVRLLERHFGVSADRRADGVIVLRRAP